MSFMDTLTEGTPSTVEQQTTTETAAATEEKPFLVVGDRVFKTQEDAIKHINSAQEHISKLENDWDNATTLIDRQSELLERSSRVDELVSAVKQNSSSQEEHTAPVDRGELIAEAINAFEQRQSERTVQEQRRSNWTNVSSTLNKLYGDKADEVVQKVIGEHGISMDRAVELAGDMPTIFLRMFDEGKSSTVKPNISSVNTEVVASQPAEGPRRSFMRMSSKDKARYIQAKLAEYND